MNAHAYSEDQLVEQPAIGLFAALGWQTVSALDETFGAGGTAGARNQGRGGAGRAPARRAGANSTRRCRRRRFQTAIDELTRDRSAMSLEAANREVYRLLKEGITVSVPDREHGGQKTERLRVVDWEHPENNDFLLVSQFTVTGPLYTCRPDLVGFVNGLPWVVIELKKPGVPARAAFDENLTHYKQQIPALFWSNALLIASNGTDSRVGSLTADWGRWVEWKRIEREDEPRRVSLEVMLRGTCDRTRLLDLVENFTLFSEHKAGLVKIIGQNHQFLGVNNAIASMLEARKLGHGRGGVFWQTQGSGKSFSMVFFAQKVLRKLAGNWTFVVVTDRVELDEQIAKTFKTTGAVSEAEGDECHAASGAHLRELLARQPPLRLHAGAQVPDAGAALRPFRRDRADRRGAPQPVRHAGAQHARRAAQGDVPGLYRHAADRRRGAHQGSLRRLRLDLRLPAVHRGRRHRAAVLREPHAGIAARQSRPERRHLPPDRGRRTRRGAGGQAGAGAGAAIPPDHPRRPAGNRGAGHRAALPRPGLRRQGDGGVDRQGHRAAHARQGEGALGGGNRTGAEGTGRAGTISRAAAR